jgi:hypothetical protein
MLVERGMLRGTDVMDMSGAMARGNRHQQDCLYGRDCGYRYRYCNCTSTLETTRVNYLRARSFNFNLDLEYFNILYNYTVQVIATGVIVI